MPFATEENGASLAKRSRELCGKVLDGFEFEASMICDSLGSDDLVLVLGADIVVQEVVVEVA